MRGFRRAVGGCAVAAVVAVGVALLAAATSGGPSAAIAAATASTSVTATTTGPVPANSVALHSGPGYGYAAAGFAQPYTTYAVSCFSTPGINPGTTGPYTISDMTTVWYLLANPATPTQGIGYIQSTDPAFTFSIANASIPDQVGRCATDPLPPSPTSPSGQAVQAPTPLKCDRGILSQGLNTITVHSSTGHLDVTFISAVPAPQSVDVQDNSTGQSGSGYALSDEKATYHFTEDANTTFGDHTLSISVDGVLGGPNGPIPGIGEVPPDYGDTIDGAVSWEVVSDGCIA